MSGAARALRRAALLALLALLLGCRASAPSPTHAPSSPRPTETTEPSAPTPAPAPVEARPGRRRPASAREQQLVTALARETEQLRGLRFLRPVTLVIEDRVAMRSYVDRALDDPRFERARRRYLALGVLPRALDVRGALLAIMEEELLGYYDPKEQRLALRDDVARRLVIEGADPSGSFRATLVHELVHALQDQHFDLQRAMDADRTTDADDAYGALVEGDAMLTMLAWLGARAGESLATLSADPERVRSMVARSNAELTPTLRKAPALLRDPLLFRYREGAGYCAALVRAGGFARVDASHRAPPETTREVELAHLQADASHTLRALSDLTDEQTRSVDDDVLGALEIAIVLAPSGLSRAFVVRQWRGDRYVVLATAEDEPGSLWLSRWASEDAAARVAAAFTNLRDPARRVARLGTHVLVAHGLTAPGFERVRLQLEHENKLSTREKPRASPQNRELPLATSVHRN